MTRFLQAGLCRICVAVKEKMARRAKLADLENELQDEISPESFLSGFKLAPGIAADFAFSCSFHDDEPRRSEALQGHAGALQRRVHPPDLRPHHTAKAGRSRPGHGKSHGTGTVKTFGNKQRTGRKAELPCRCALSIPCEPSNVGRSVGQVFQCPKSSKSVLCKGYHLLWGIFQGSRALGQMPHIPVKLAAQLPRRSWRLSLYRQTCRSALAAKAELCGGQALGRARSRIAVFHFSAHSHTLHRRLSGHPIGSSPNRSARAVTPFTIGNHAWISEAFYKSYGLTAPVSTGTSRLSGQTGRRLRFFGKRHRWTARPSRAPPFGPPAGRCCQKRYFPYTDWRFPA